MRVLLELELQEFRQKAVRWPARLRTECGGAPSFATSSSAACEANWPESALHGSGGFVTLGLLLASLIVGAALLMQVTTSFVSIFTGDWPRRHTRASG